MAPVAAVEELQSEDNNGDVVAAIPDKKQFQRKKGGHSKGQQGSSGRQGQQVAGGKSRDANPSATSMRGTGRRPLLC